MNVDVVVVSYEQLEVSERERKTYLRNVKKYKTETAGAVVKPERPNAPLHSSIWADLGRPIKRLVLDKAEVASTIIRHPSILPLRNPDCREVSFARDEACNSQIDEFMQKTKQEKDKHNSSIQGALVQKPGERPSNIQVGLKPFVPDQPLAELQLPDDAEMVTLEDTE
ncbi:hypothetical protein PWT90_04768 [Aphanocladium album]|nr:hypothetical protein PWT90_04768 [Aphanocladium album]